MAGGRGVEIGFLLDRRWCLLRNEEERTKRPALLALAAVLGGAGVPYAVIGGIAMQVHHEEPRTTLDIDVAVVDAAQIPRDGLAAAGFVFTGRFGHSETWRGPEGVPVQFTDDARLAEAVRRADEVRVAGACLRVINRRDLLRAKLRAAADPGRRRSKQLQDLADAHALLEASPELEAALEPNERAALRGDAPGSPYRER